MKFNAAHLSQVDRVVGIATIVLFISLFLPWFSVSGYTGSGISAHSFLWITLIVSLVMIAVFALNALDLWRTPSTSPLAEEQILLIGASINFVLVLLAFLFKPSVGFGIVDIKVGWAWGSFVGLAAAVVALGAAGQAGHRRAQSQEVDRPSTSRWQGRGATTHSYC